MITNITNTSVVGDQWDTHADALWVLSLRPSMIELNYVNHNNNNRYHIPALIVLVDPCVCFSFIKYGNWAMKQHQGMILSAHEKRSNIPMMIL